MKRFTFLIAVLIAVLVAAGCAAVEDRGGQRLNAPNNPVPGFEHNPNDNPGAVESFQIESSSNVTSPLGTIELEALLPPHLIGADVRWNLSGIGIGPQLGFLTSTSGLTTTWNAPNAFGLAKTITAEAILGDTSERATIKVAVTKGLAPRLIGPSHVGFYNNPTFTVDMQANYRAGATIEWSITPENGTLTPDASTHSATWTPSTWRSDFYTITATIKHEDEDYDIDISRTFTTSFCSQGRTNTADDPCGIENIHQLAAIHYFLDGHFLLLNDIDASVTQDWNSQPGTGRYGFWPLGADGTQDPRLSTDVRRIPTTFFSGVFDGGGNTISNLHIIWPGSIGVGLFGFVHKDAVIKRVHVEDAEIVGYEFIGGIAGSVDGTIEQVSVTNSRVEWKGHDRTCQSRPDYLQGARVGGVVGLLSSRGGKLTESYALNTYVSGCIWVGGLVGISAGEVSDSYSMGGSIYAPISSFNSGFTGVVTETAKVERTFALMGINVAHTAMVLTPGVLDSAYWSSDYLGAALLSNNGTNITPADFAQIGDDWDLWQPGTGPGAFISVPDLINNPR